jgi:hypothetical protein
MDHLISRDVLQLHVARIFWKMNYHCISRMYLLQYPGECGYNMTQHLHIPAERREFLTMKEGGYEGHGMLGHPI